MACTDLAYCANIKIALKDKDGGSIKELTANLGRDTYYNSSGGYYQNNIEASWILGGLLKSRHYGGRAQPHSYPNISDAELEFRTDSNFKIEDLTEDTIKQVSSISFSTVLN